MQRHCVFLLALLTCLGLGPMAWATPTTKPLSIQERIAQAQGEGRFDAHQAVRVPMTVQFKGKMVVDGTVLMTPDMSKIRIDLKNQNTLVFNDGKAWLRPADSQLKRGRFLVKTWPYFFAVPFKLDDPGVHIKARGSAKLDGKSYKRARMTFGSKIGDSPDDWYLLYQDPDSGRLKAMVYIVTYGKSMKEAKKNPHAIVYRDFTTVDGVTYAQHWTFHHWTRKGGIQGDPIGQVDVGKIEFVNPEPGAFEKPDNSRALTAPGNKADNKPGANKG